MAHLGNPSSQPLRPSNAAPFSLGSFSARALAGPAHPPTRPGAMPFPGKENGQRELAPVAPTADLVAAVAEEAARSTLARVAKDYALNYGALAERYAGAVVAECARTFAPGADPGSCAGLTKAGRPCGKRATACGYCAGHAALRHSQREEERRARAYVASLEVRDPHRAHLEAITRAREVPMAVPSAFQTAL